MSYACRPNTGVEVPCLRSSQWQPLTVGSIICRCSAALVTEVQTARTAGRNAAELGSLQSRAQERPDLREVETLEALWAPRSSDDSRAMLEHLQAQVAASGSCSGLNGA